MRSDCLAISQNTSFFVDKKFSSTIVHTLFIPKTIKEKSCQIASPEAQIYFEYKNRYPTFRETII